ncbi:response regulator transcription factor [Paenibacillus sp. MWE-103]|uniref:Response regulator transcription factor n=1 Tax=Paenibacillus artemisiicola TaxID=1172618 RepID=A0ABS3W633_9BACL|nr:response regulator transcription factor [Paenibacillus artemisiicola]MBO7743777.1 response regulator transcription factor [Paenibacillus artemisiicola]
MRVLIVEDDAALLALIRSVFEDGAFHADGAENGDDGYYLAQQAIHDLIVLDVMLPGMNGIEIIRKLRAAQVGVPIILLTAKDAVKDRVVGLNAGADDYMVKPFAVSELLARARAVLRRRGTVGLDGDLTYGPLRLSMASKSAYCDETELHLTATEYALLEFFMIHRNQILTREQISDRIWGFDSGAALSAVDVYVHHLRKKLMVQEAGRLLRTVRGIGFIFKGEPHVQ